VARKDVDVVRAHALTGFVGHRDLVGARAPDRPRADPDTTSGRFLGLGGIADVDDAIELVVLGTFWA